MNSVPPSGTGDGEARRFLIATAVARYPKCPAWDRPGLVEARERVIELFTRTLGYRHQASLGLNPTRNQVTDQLRVFCKSADRREDDMLAVYISGHGEVLDDGGEHVLFTADTDPDDISYTALPTVELARTMLRDTKLRRLMLVLDTCYSGQGGNELAAAALQRIGSQWQQTTGSGLVVVSSAQPHQQAQAGLFPRLLTDAVSNWATAGHRPQTLSVSTVVQQMNDHPDRPGYQDIGLALIGLTGEPPPFLVNPRHTARLTDVDLAIQQAAEFDEQARRRDTELVNRMLVRAMGYHGDASQSWWFCGRHSALADLAQWLSIPAADDSSACRVVTAGPGSGKTAVLGLIAALAHPERRRAVPVDALNLPPLLMPAADSVDVAVYAQNLTNTDVLKGLAAAAEAQADTVDQLLRALESQQRERPFTALIDALDEAATPDTLCSRILRPLIDHSNGRIRLLLGTRSYLLDHLGIPARQRHTTDQVIDLDDPRYADPEALRTYTVRNLLEAHHTSPYRRNVTALRPVADAVAAAAGTSFLVARITAGTLAAADHVADSQNPSWRDSLPRHAGQAVRDDLTHRLGSEALGATDLLRPLAFAEGQGLPWENIWAPLASAISGRTYTDEDLLWLRRTAGGYVVEATESERSAYRLYHQALAEHLREGTDPQAVHAAFTKILTERVPYQGDATRDWSRAHPYILNHLAAHAALAGHMEEVLDDAEYLVHAAPRRLIPHLHHAKSDLARLTTAVYRASIGLHATATPAVRRQVLALEAARAGATRLHRQLTHHIPEHDWAPLWATGSTFSSALRDTLTGHEGVVEAVACTVLNGNPVAVSCDDLNVLRVWDLASGVPIGSPLTDHSGPVRGVACASLDGIPIAVTVGDYYGRTVQVWDLASGTAVGGPFAGHDGVVRGVACTTLEGAPVAVTGGDDHTVRVWDLRSGRPLGRPLTGHTGQIKAVACTSLNGIPVAVTGSDDETVRVWDLASGEPIGRPLTEHAGTVYAVVCTTLEGAPIAVAASGQTVRLWDLASGRPVGRRMTGHRGLVTAVACTTLDSTPVAVTGGDDHTVRVWDLASGMPVGEPLTGHTGDINAVACATVDDIPVAVTVGWDETVRVWALASSNPVGRPRTGHTLQVSGVAYTTVDGMPVAVTAGWDSMLRVWDMASGTPVRQLPARHNGPAIVEAVACATVVGIPVAVVVVKGEVWGWDLASGTLIGRAFTSSAMAHAVACTAIDGTPVALIAGDRTVWVCDLTSGRPIGRPLAGHPGRIEAIACTTVDDTTLAVTSGDGTMLVWDVSSGTPTGQFSMGRLAFAGAVACTTIDGTPVALSADARGLRVWDLVSSCSDGRFLTVDADLGFVNAVACAIIDRVPVAAIASRDQKVSLYNLRTGESGGAVAAVSPEALALTSDGHLLLGMGQDVAVFSRRTQRWMPVDRSVGRRFRRRM